MFSGAGRRSQRYALQQPEVHLHPRAQAALGEVILELAAEYGAGFFIETHSDYLIDRFRLRLHEKDPTPSLSSQVLYFEREDGMNKVHAIPILSDGRYDESQPEGFRSFFIHEQLSLLGL